MSIAPHRHIGRKILILVSLVLGSGSSASAAVTVLQPTTEKEAIIYADTPEQRELAEWALGRYKAAGLELPPLVIEFAGPDLANCDGGAGRIYRTAGSTLVKVCWNDRFIVLHELAHAWALHNLSADKQEPFMAMRAGVTSWASSQVSWAQRGCEHAANVIAWGVLEDPFPVSRTYPNDPESLWDAFVFLTGTNPLHNGGPEIQEPDRQFFSAGRTNPSLERGR